MRFIRYINDIAVQTPKRYINYDIWLNATYYTKRMLDVDAGGKGLLDGLEKGKLFMNDKQVKIFKQKIVRDSKYEEDMIEVEYSLLKAGE